MALRKVARDGMSVQNFLTDEGSKELHDGLCDELTTGNAAGNRGGLDRCSCRLTTI